MRWTPAPVLVVVTDGANLEVGRLHCPERSLGPSQALVGKGRLGDFRVAAQVGKAPAWNPPP